MEDIELQMELNEKLKQLRKDKGWTQERLAEELFVSRTAVSKWESGRPDEAVGEAVKARRYVDKRERV